LERGALGAWDYSVCEFRAAGNLEVASRVVQFFSGVL